MGSVTKRQHLFSLPCFGKAQRIGLLGGSFNPAHEGHLHVALTALKKMQLDWVWLLVSPGNPLKDKNALAPLEVRIEKLRRLITHPRILIADFESQLATHYSIDVLRFLKMRAPEVQFVWLMGADSMINFHAWKSWQEIAASMPLAVINRPGYELRALSSPVAQKLKNRRLQEKQASLLFAQKPPAWVFIHDRLNPLSSTALRNKS